MSLNRDRRKVPIGEMFLKPSTPFHLGLTTFEVMMTSSKMYFCNFANFIIPNYWVKSKRHSTPTEKMLNHCL